jgi:high-affinity iron transporter
LWDTSAVISNGSLTGRVLQGLVGYDAQPAGMQLAFYVTVLLAIWAGMAWARRRSGNTT